MENVHKFVDYYSIMQVAPNCDAKLIENAYRYFAKIYHPDHARTADITKFTELTEAYGVLRDPGKRAEYDLSYFSKAHSTFSELPSRRIWKSTKQLQ